MTNAKQGRRNAVKRQAAATERAGVVEAGWAGEDLKRFERLVSPDSPLSLERPDHEESTARHDEEMMLAPLHAQTQGKFVLFNIPAKERVAGGPVMRGFVEIAAPEDDAEPVKVQVAGWSEVARDSGREYLSLKVANTESEDRELYTVGPFYGRLFKTVTKTKAGEVVRYFGFIEDADKVGEDEHGRGIYERHWELAIRAKRAVSGDGRTVYISGHLGPRKEPNGRGAEIAF